MNNRLLGIAASAFLIFLPVSGLAQSIGTLNAQLKQAVDLSNWNKAIQIVDKMIIAEPAQASRLETYKAQLQQRINATNKKIPTSSLAPQKTSTPKKSTGVGTVTVTNALVARNETEKGSVTPQGKFIPAIVKYDLTAEIYNSTNRIARSVKVFYDIVSWNKDNNQSGSFIVLDIPAHRKANFEQNLQWEGPLDEKNKYEGVRVRINQVEWIDEDYDSGSNDTHRLFGYWGKL
jgi:hypothetical protein